jgi:DNA polymerase-1
MDELSQLHLGHTPLPVKAVAGKGKTEISFAQVELKPATAYAAEDADVTLRLYNVLKPKLIAAGMVTVYETLERPLPPVLAAMECAGIKVDPPRLRQLSHEFGVKMAAEEAQAHQLATCCSAKWAWPAPRRPRRALGRLTSRCWKTWPTRATPCRARS